MRDELFIRAREGEPEALDELVRENLGLVRSIAARLSRPAEAEDAFQSGCLGLVKAIRGFDPQRGACFSTYAFPFIAGEIRRSRRADGGIRIGRRLSELAARIRRLDPAGNMRLSDIACELCVTSAEAALAICASQPVLSLSEPVSDDGTELGELIPDPSAREETAAERVLVRELVASLGERDAELVRLRFFSDLSQSETAAALGLTQPQVSRLERSILEKLKNTVLYR